MQEEFKYSITEAYQYSVVPGMEEWKKLKSLQEMAEACQIPKDILGSMTIETLIETVVNYPLFINVFAYDNKQSGLEYVKDDFNDLQELYERDDAIGKMGIYIGEKYHKTVTPEDIILSAGNEIEEVHKDYAKVNVKYGQKDWICNLMSIVIFWI